MLVNMGRVIRQTVLRFADCIALVNYERDRRFTYSEMHKLSNKISHILTDRFKLGQGDFYITLLANDHMGFFHPWMFKCPVTGVWLDIRESPEEQLRQIDKASPRVVFLEKQFLGEMLDPLTQRGIDIICMDESYENHPRLYSFWELCKEASDAEVDAEVDYEDAEKHIAVMRFTGGTTGEAKCAMYSVSNFWVWGMNPGHYMHTVPFPQPRAMLFSPINHAASGSVVIPVHLKGGTLITLNAVHMDSMGKIIEQEGVELIYAVPTVLYRMLDMNLPGKYDVSSLKTIRYGAAAISPAKIEAVLEQYGSVFVQGYGSTECWPSCTILAKEDHGTDAEIQVKRLSSMGRAMPGQEILICDDEGREVSTGNEGELYFRGANTIKGYYGSKDLTLNNFTENGFWKSGDIGYMDEDGYIFLVDRKKDIIITGGYNVYATEVENCLNSHPAVENSAVVGVPDETWGEAVQAMALMRDGETVGERELIDYCKTRLARFKAPKVVLIVKELPISAAGKVLKREVRRRMLPK